MLPIILSVHLVQPFLAEPPPIAVGVKPHGTVKVVTPREVEQCKRDDVDGEYLDVEPSVDA